MFGADLIAGFPNRDRDHVPELSLDLVEDCGLTYLHVFPYSERPGTPAARMPPVAKPVRKERAARLRDAGQAALGRFLKGEVGHTVQALVERDRTARTEHYAVIQLDRPARIGTVVPARVTGASGNTLDGVRL